MALIVQKYGGSSVADAEKVKRVAKHIVGNKRKNNELVVVVSAPGEMTDDLLDMAKKITDNRSDREIDMLLSTGEQVSIALLAMAIHEQGEQAISFTGHQVGIVTDTTHTKAKIISINEKKVFNALEKGNIVIIAGFQGVDEHNDITTLGRGGSDTTAVALAAVLKADLCEIYTDVDGVYTADPRIVPNAQKIDTISYDEMLEMASLGAKVMQSRSIEFAKKYDVDVQVRSSFNTNTIGTLITKEVLSMEKVVVRGVTCEMDEAKLSLIGVPDRPGVAAKIFTSLAKVNVGVDMIVQSTGEDGINTISFTVNKSDLKKTMEILNKVAIEIEAKKILADEHIAKISIVGVGMRSHCGIAASMFEALALNKINIDMISTSEIKLSCIVEDLRAHEAVRILHDRFNLADIK
ncbi:aspartate kinase [Candidatus Desantisbacteria bacterium]|nr:aspartate kinase [Candidatus Desantisbacteria bacterium]